eukprot:2830105-Prymnesium_polylepis.2
MVDAHARLARRVLHKERTQVEEYWPGEVELWAVHNLPVPEHCIVHYPNALLEPVDAPALGGLSIFRITHLVRCTLGSAHEIVQLPVLVCEERVNPEAESQVAPLLWQ